MTEQNSEMALSRLIRISLFLGKTRHICCAGNRVYDTFGPVTDPETKKNCEKKLKKQVVKNNSCYKGILKYTNVQQVI